MLDGETAFDAKDKGKPEPPINIEQTTQTKMIEVFMSARPNVDAHIRVAVPIAAKFCLF